MQIMKKESREEVVLSLENMLNYIELSLDPDSIYVILNKLAQVSTKDYNSEGTALMVIRTL